MSDVKYVEFLLEMILKELGRQKELVVTFVQRHEWTRMIEIYNPTDFDVEFLGRHIAYKTTIKIPFRTRR